MNDPKHSFDSPELEPVSRLLAARAERLRHRPGLGDRVFSAVEHELGRGEVLANIESARGADMTAMTTTSMSSVSSMSLMSSRSRATHWRRHFAAVAVFAVACGVTLAIVLRGGGSGSGSGTGSPTPGNPGTVATVPASMPDSIIVADGSHAERILLALTASREGNGADAGRTDVLDELIPGSNVELDELDLEMQRLLGGGESLGSFGVPGEVSK